MTTLGPGAGTGRVGYWQAGVWVESDPAHSLEVPRQAPCGIATIKDNRQTAEVRCCVGNAPAGVGC